MTAGATRGPREHLHTAMKQLAEADRLWGSVTTAMPPRSGLLFAPASKLTPSVERLRDRAAGRYISVLPNEVPRFASTARSAATQTDLAVQTLDHALSEALPLTIAGTGAQRTASVPQL